jgi:three-Cys-motif partner protein
MSPERERGPVDPHRFGGDWTEKKLAALAGYLRMYTTALKHQHFETWYVDAFAGTGYRHLVRPESGEVTGLLPGTDPVDLVLDGSARIALRTVPPFDRFVFIEQSAARCAQLDALRIDSGFDRNRVVVLRSEANDCLRAILRTDWRHRRAVLFLDPYGLQVDWSTLESIAATRAIDCWVLFPLSAAARLLTRSGKAPESWKRRLDALFGTPSWRRDLYDAQVTPTLFGEDETEVVRATIEAVGRYFNKRLKSIFGGVVEQPGVLRNSKNTPLYLLCFAAANPSGARLALKLANAALEDLR